MSRNTVVYLKEDTRAILRTTISMRYQLYHSVYPICYQVSSPHAYQDKISEEEGQIRLSDMQVS
jgi:hypothetical protein